MDASDGNELCIQLAINKLIMCCNTRQCGEKNANTDTDSTDMTLKLKFNEEIYREDISKYSKISTHFVLSFRYFVDEEEERKKEKNSKLIGSLLNSNFIQFSTHPLRAMTIVLQKFLNFCPKKCQSLIGLNENILPYCLVHSDSTDICLGKHKSKNVLSSY